MRKSLFSKIFVVAVMVFAVSLVLGSAGFAGKQDAAVRVDINNASVKELTAVKGIGPKKAEAIVNYRTEKGRFNSVEDLKKVSGIGEKIYEKIKDLVTVDGG